MKSLVLGAAGFCGRHLLRRIKEEADSEVVGADVVRNPSGLACDRYSTVDTTQANQVVELVARERPDRVYDLVGISTGETEDIYKVNVIGRVNVMEAVRTQCAGAAVLLVGSAAEYGIIPESDCPVTEEHVCKPIGPYGLSKYAATQIALGYFRQYQLRLVIARPFNIIGAGMPGSLLLGAVIRRAKAALAESDVPVIKIGNLDTQRDFIDVGDVVDAYVGLLSSDCWGETYNICSGQPVPIMRLVDLALSHAHREVAFEVDTDLLRTVDAPVIYGSYEKARATIGFQPRMSLEESVRAAWLSELCS